MKHHKKLKNAYLVALTNRDLWEYGHPDGSCELIHATNSTQARCIYKKQNFLNEKASSLQYKRYEEEDLYLFEGYEKSKKDIERELEYRNWYSEMVDMVNNNPNAKVYIYSGQWGAYWGPNYCDYTSYKDKAGIYDIEDAWNAVSHVGLEKRISFELIK